MVHRRAHDHAPRHRHQESARSTTSSCSSRSRSCSARDRRSASCTSTRRTGIPFIPPNTGDFGELRLERHRARRRRDLLRLHRIRRGVTAAQEAKNPQRDMPIGILGSLAICTVLYILDGARHDRHRAIHRAQRSASGRSSRSRRPAPALAWLRSIVKIGAIAGLASVVLVMLMGQPRIFYSMAQATACCRRCSPRCTRGSRRRT